MNKIKIIIIATLLSLSSNNSVSATTFQEALSSAYSNNPFLKSERENVKITDEQRVQAVSGFLPNISANAERGKRETEQLGVSNEQVTETREILIRQPLFRGGRTFNNLKLAKNNIQAAREGLRQVEQDVLLEAITAYMDIIRDQEVLELSKSNVEVLQKHLDVTQERFDLGEVTKTDVAQAEASLSIAKSEQTNAEGVLESSRARYERIVGNEPGILKPVNNPIVIEATLGEIIEIAMDENPSVLQALYSEMAAKNRISVEKGRLLPSIDFQASKDKQKGLLFSSSDLENERFSVNVSIPLYQSGAEYSSVRQAKFNHGRLKLGLEDQRNKVREAVIESYNNFHVARAVIKSNQAAIDASEIALDGTQEEAKFGARTTLDVLDAEQDLFEAKANLIRSKRDEIVSSYTLLSYVGRLNPRELGLSVDIYDPKKNYNKRKYQIIGF